ncbi:MAG: fibrobacter succinogenes major paralogous domain-containing protein, partial [Candidatus Cloacimonetes bacterium]|nr:fibrobacter succinogenes major paralogous domain-containing protein [Candidatus Cloacimonadota bacterium]
SDTYYASIVESLQTIYHLHFHYLWDIPEFVESSLDYQVRISGLEYPEVETFSEYFSIFNSSNSVIDIDGNIYNTVQIGDQVWMAENLRVKRYKNGYPLKHYEDDTSWFDTYYGAYCHYDNDTTYFETYGLLYNWLAVDDYRMLAPTGWHVPTYEEWQILLENLDGWQVAGGKMKTTGTLEQGDGLWHEPNTGATNESCMFIVPGGYRLFHGGCDEMGYQAAYWTSSEDSIFTAPYIKLYHDACEVHSYNQTKCSGFSIRCLKD